MKNSFKHWIKNIFLGCAALIIVSCLLFLLLQIAARYEEGICYEKLGKEYHVPATYYSISEAILNRVKTTLISGMDHEQVVTGLQRIAPVSIWGAGSMWKDGSYTEYVELKICFFQRNNIIFLAHYTKEGKLDVMNFNLD